MGEQSYCWQGHSLLVYGNGSLGLEFCEIDGSTMTSASSRRLRVLLQDFGLTTTADVRALQASYRRLAKLHHPDMVRPAHRAKANSEFALLQARYQEALQLLERENPVDESPKTDHIIRSNGGLFYHDPYKWRPREHARAKEKQTNEEPASLGTKVKGLSLLICMISGTLYVFDRTARKRNLLWND